MACKCLEQLKEEAKKEFKAIDIKLGTSGILDTQTGETVTLWPSLPMTINPESEGARTISLVPTYCPICGTKYKE